MKNKNATVLKDVIDYPIQGIKYSFDGQGIMEKEGGWGEYGENKYFKNPSTGFPYKNQWVSFGKQIILLIRIVIWQAVGK